MLKICRGDPVKNFTTFLTLSSKFSQETSRTVIGVVGVDGCATTLSLRVRLGFPFWVCVGPQVHDSADLLGL